MYARQAQSVTTVRNWQPPFRAAVVAVVVNSPNATKEHFNGLNWSPPGRELQELEKLATVSFEPSVVAQPA